MLDVERYRKVNVDARAPESLFTDTNLLALECNTGFLAQCVGKFREVNFADRATGRICLHLTSGVPDWADAEALERALASVDTRAALFATAPAVFAGGLPAPDRPRNLGDVADNQSTHRLGR